MGFLDYTAITFFAALVFIIIIAFGGIFDGKGPSAGFAGIILMLIGGAVAGVAAVVLAAGILLT